jgi:hypothetical protein
LVVAREAFDIVIAPSGAFFGPGGGLTGLDTGLALDVLGTGRMPLLRPVGGAALTDRDFAEFLVGDFVATDLFAADLAPRFLRATTGGVAASRRTILDFAVAFVTGAFLAETFFTNVFFTETFFGADFFFATDFLTTAFFAADFLAPGFLAAIRNIFFGALTFFFTIFFALCVAIVGPLVFLPYQG